MKIINISKCLFFAFSLGSIFSSCKEDKLDTYYGETNVFFSLQRWTRSNKNISLDDFLVDGGLHSDNWRVEATWDSTAVSLALDGTLEGYRVVLLPVDISGDVVDYDRQLGYKVDKESTAVEGTHFKVDAYIPANKTMGALAVSVSRAALRDTALWVGFSLIANEHFQTNYRTITRSQSDTTKISMLDFKLNMSGYLIKPSYWSRWQSYFGDFSFKKMYLIIELCNADITYFYDNYAKMTVSLANAYGSALKLYLKEMSDAGTPVYEEDEVTLMSAGTSA